MTTSRFRPSTVGLSLLLASSLFLFGCKTPEDYAHNNSITARWLNNHAGVPRMNVGGTWHSDDWGDANFRQSGNRVTGTLGGYPVGGAIDGRTLHLAITEDGWTSYSAVLTAQPDGTLVGAYSDSVPFSPEDQSSIRLTRFMR